MNRILILGLAAAMLWALAGPSLAAGKNPGGYMVDTQGKKIVVTEFLSLLSKFPFQYQDAEMTVPLSDIKSLTRQLDGDRIALVTTKGKKFMITGEMGISYTDMIQFKYLDPISGQEQQDSIDPMLLKKIVLDWKK